MLLPSVTTPQVIYLHKPTDNYMPACHTQHPQQSAPPSSTRRIGRAADRISSTARHTASLTALTAALAAVAASSAQCAAATTFLIDSGQQRLLQCQPARRTPIAGHRAAGKPQVHKPCPTAHPVPNTVHTQTTPCGMQAQESLGLHVQCAGCLHRCWADVLIRSHDICCFCSNQSNTLWGNHTCRTNGEFCFA